MYDQSCPEKLEEILANQKNLKSELDDFLRTLTARTATCAIRYSRSVVGLKVTEKKRPMVIDYIKQNFDKKYYFDIVTYDEGIYVLLKDPYIAQLSKKSALDNYYEKLNDLYMNIPMSKKQKN